MNSDRNTQPNSRQKAGSGKGVGIPADKGRVSATSAHHTPQDLRQIKLADISILSEVQVRVRLNPGIVRDYAQQLRDGTKFPPVLVFRVNDKLVLVDGHHRLAAHKLAGFEAISSVVQDGDLAMAFTAAVNANAAHGLRFSNADKRQAVGIALKTFPTTSDRAIADICHVSDRFVNKARAASGANGSHVRVGLDGKKYKIANKTQKGSPKMAAKKSHKLLAQLTNHILALCDKDPNMARAYAVSLRWSAKRIDDQLANAKTPTEKLPVSHEKTTAAIPTVD